MQRRRQSSTVDGANGVVGDADGETQADKEVGGRQVLQVDSDITGWKDTSTEVELQCKAVEDQTNLQGKKTKINTIIVLIMTTTRTIVTIIITRTRTTLTNLNYQGQDHRPHQNCQNVVVVLLMVAGLLDLMCF